MAIINRLQDGEDIPDSDHVMRYCSPQYVDDGEIAEPAFSLRKNEDHLSVNWLEYCSGSFHERLQAIRADIAAELKLRDNGRFAKISVGKARETIEGVQIVHKPRPLNPSHTGIYPSSEKNREQTLELANLVGDSDVFPAT